MNNFIEYFFFSSRRRHTRYWRDWSSDVCSSDLRRRTLPDLEDQAASGVGRYLGGIAREVVVVVEEPQAPFGRAPAGVQVKQHGDQLGFGIGVDLPVLFPGAAANGEHRRPVLEIHAQALADEIPERDAVHLLH